MSESIAESTTRLPIIGTIRTGEKRKNAAGKEYPVSLDYFVARGQFASKFDEVYSKPDQIPVVFISDDDRQSCYERWDGRDDHGRLAGYGDGLNYFLWNYAGDRGQYVPTINRDDVVKFSQKYNIKWRQTLTIYFIIPAIRGVFGVWKYETHGEKSSINNIRDTYDEIKTMAGTVVNIPFDLCVKKAISNKPDVKTSYPVVTLVPNLSSENMETLRNFLQSGMDTKRIGILNEKKFAALGEHVSDAEIVNSNQLKDKTDHGT
jgi:hypothetical protein